MKKELSPYLDGLLRSIIQGESVRPDPARLPPGWKCGRKQIERGRWLTTVRPLDLQALKGHGRIVRLVVESGQDLYQVACPVSYLPDDHEMQRTGSEGMLVNMDTGHVIADPIARGLLGALDQAEHQFEQATDPASRHAADGMRVALEDTLTQLERGVSVAECKVGIETAISAPINISRAQLREYAPLSETEVRSMRDKVFRELIALIDRLQATAA
jgi:hypothetical protein